MTRHFLALAALLLAAGCSVVGIRTSYEQPTYQALDRVDGAEVRRYAAWLVAEARVQAPDVETARVLGSDLLQDYVLGRNRAVREIGMTVPVVTDLPGPAGAWAARFYMPSRFTPASLPEPLDRRITVRTLPEETIAALALSGEPSDEQLVAAKADLMQRLDGSAWRPTGQPVTLFYDPPWTLAAFRRTEVAVMVERR